MAFYAAAFDRHDKHVAIVDDESTIVLELDNDDVNPDDVTPEAVQRIVDALNREFYPEAA